MQYSRLRPESRLVTHRDTFLEVSSQLCIETVPPVTENSLLQYRHSQSSVACFLLLFFFARLEPSRAAQVSVYSTTFSFLLSWTSWLRPTRFHNTWLFHFPLNLLFFLRLFCDLFLLHFFYLCLAWRTFNYRSVLNHSAPLWAHTLLWFLLDDELNYLCKWHMSFCHNAVTVNARWHARYDSDRHLVIACWEFLVDVERYIVHAVGLNVKKPPRQLTY